MSSPVSAGSAIAGFRVDSLIGQGAMGSVYEAEDTKRGGRVALKVLVRDLAEDARFRQRFLRESKLAASLDHPHVVPIVDAGEEIRSARSASSRRSPRHSMPRTRQGSCIAT